MRDRGLCWAPSFFLTVYKAQYPYIVITSFQNNANDSIQSKHNDQSSFFPSCIIRNMLIKSVFVIKSTSNKQLIDRDNGSDKIWYVQQHVQILLPVIILSFVHFFPTVRELEAQSLHANDARLSWTTGPSALALQCQQALFSVCLWVCTP